MDRHRKGVGSRNKKSADVEFVDPESAGRLITGRQLLSIHPDLGAVVDAVENHTCHPLDLVR